MDGLVSGVALRLPTALGAGRDCEQAALKVLCLIANQNRPNRADLVGHISGWKTVPNALTIDYGD
jgi:hypothetical protein